MQAPYTVTFDAGEGIFDSSASGVSTDNKTRTKGGNEYEYMG